MRIVYDTSVLATIVSRRDLIIQMQVDIFNGSIILVTSPFILDELERVLGTKFGLTKQGAKSRVRLLARVASVVQPEAITTQVSRDANDGPIVATALTGEAEYIVTLDEDLLVLEQYKGILIITPTIFENVLDR
jgi:putative PIN family toxin of toxin-antitoxin system